LHHHFFEIYPDFDSLGFEFVDTPRAAGITASDIWVSLMLKLQMKT
jgi:hypothetical protein